MKITGLITEYNPFHNGHQYHIEKAKKLTGADKVVVVMSGNFVQRGDQLSSDGICYFLFCKSDEQSCFKNRKAA